MADDESEINVPIRPQEPEGFYAGNKLWQLRKFNKGPERLVKSAEHLVEEAIAYFQWADENPHEEEVVGWYQGDASTHGSKKLRALTIAGLCAFLGTSRREWLRWKQERPDLVPAIEWCETIMWEMKFSAAAAGLLNANIVSRDLGLAEVSDHTSSDGSMSQKPTVIEFVAPQQQNPEPGSGAPG